MPRMKMRKMKDREINFPSEKVDFKGLRWNLWLSPYRHAFCHEIYWKPPMGTARFAPGNIYLEVASLEDPVVTNTPQVCFTLLVGDHVGRWAPVAEQTMTACPAPWYAEPGGQGYEGLKKSCPIRFIHQERNPAAHPGIVGPAIELLSVREE